MLTRSLAAQNLLEEIALSGAASGNQHGMHTSPSPELDELVAKGYVSPMELLNRTDHNHYTLTALSRSFIKPGIELGNPMPILQWKRASVGDDLAQYTLAELILHLGSQGWQDTEHSKSKKCAAFTLEGDKLWYRSPMLKISKLYLHALAVAKERIQSGLISKVYHFQSQAYYRCIIEACQDVLPDQPLAYYKLLLGRNVPVSTQKTDAEPKSKLHDHQSTMQDDFCNQAWIIGLGIGR